MTHSIAASCAILLATIGTVIAVYLVAHRIAGRDVEEATRELASSGVFRISALHGLMIALVFAQLALGFRTLETDVIGEARVVGNIFSDAARHGGAEAGTIQDSWRRYVEIVLDEEWPALARGDGLSDAAWHEGDAIYTATLALEGETPRLQMLRTAMADNARRLAELRDLRESHSLQAGRQPFWFAAISGLVLMSAGYLTFAPTRRNIAILGLFAVYSGIVFHLIHSCSNPFTPPGALQPASLERLRLTMGGRP